MNIKKRALILLLACAVATFLSACSARNVGTQASSAENIGQQSASEQHDEAVSTSEPDSNQPQTIVESPKPVALTNTYITQFTKINLVEYPPFQFDYPDGWTIIKADVTQNGEVVILANERGVEITYRHIGGIPQGGLGGGSGVFMQLVNMSKAADSSFIPSYVQATDHSALGAFMVAKLKVTGDMDVKTDADFTEVDGAVAYAVVPEAWTEDARPVTKEFSGEFAFWYSGYISIVAEAPNGEFTKAEEQEVKAILSSF